MVVGFQAHVAVNGAERVVATDEQPEIVPKSVWNVTLPATEAVAVMVSMTPTCTVPFARAIETVVGGLLTVIETLAVVVKPELACVPVTTYVVVGEYEAGVPEIDPEVVSKARPVGNAGLTE